MDNIKGQKKNHRLVFALIIASASVILLFLSLLAFWIYRKIPSRPYKKRGRAQKVEGEGQDAQTELELSDLGIAIVDGSQNKNNFKLSGTVGYVAHEYLLAEQNRMFTSEGS